MEENILSGIYNIDNQTIELLKIAEENVSYLFKDIENIREYNQLKVISAMQQEKLSQTDFYWTSGYGYGDMGRDKVERIYARIFGTEAALVRAQIASGTHAIYLSLSANLKYGDELLYITGKPYDTLLNVIGYEGESRGTLLEDGIKFKFIDLCDDNKFNDEQVLKSISEKTKVVAIQRSTGYSDRPAVSVDEIGRISSLIKKQHSNIIIFVDNCYGEFTDKVEPSNFDIDIMAGSLIKNPGGGLALSGGYIVGKEEFIDRAANRLIAPGIGKECGLSFGMTRSILQGLFFAPHVVSESVKGAILMAEVYSKLGFEVVPAPSEKRYDIVQAIKFENADKLNCFCESIQSSSIVDSFVKPSAWDMPGYNDKIIMAAGGFVDGSSIEMSADGPMRAPYFAYYQGGLFYDHIKLGIMKSVQELKNYGYL